ncbi:MAG: hypothetical protein JST01_05385, partial [Cyanobacteria bacterium SZAS TMP-1]|nr:hypothetical protein [Cyanobacteria bacterium SZAS TMP-1]
PTKVETTGSGVTGKHTETVQPQHVENRFDGTGTASAGRKAEVVSEPVVPSQVHPPVPTETNLGGKRIVNEPAAGSVESAATRGPDAVNVPVRERPVAALSATGEAPAVIANKAESHLQVFTRATGESGVTLTPQAQTSLKELSTQLQTISRSGEVAVPVATRQAMAENIATIERSLTASGADAGVTTKLNQLKATVAELTPGADVAVVKATEPAVSAALTRTGEAPAVIASKAESHLEVFTSATGESAVTLNPQAQRSLQELTTQLRTISRSGEAAVPVATREAMAENIATIERSMTASGADASVTAKFNQLKTTVSELTPVTEQAIGNAVKPAVTAVLEPTVVAGKAAENVQAITRLSGEGRVTLTQEAERGLQSLDTQLKTIAQQGSEGLTLAVRNEMSENIAVIERSLAKSGADPVVTRELNQLKSTINEMAPSRVAPIAPVTEAPITLAARAGEKVEVISQNISQGGLKLGTEAEQSLQSINAQLKVVAEGGTPLTAQASQKLAQEVATVERAVAASGTTDATVTTAVRELKATVGEISTATVERQQMTAVQTGLNALESDGAKLSSSVQKLAKEIQELPVTTAADQRVASTISQKLETLEQKLTPGRLAETPVSTTGEIQTIVRELEKPEYSRFFAENPRAARALEEVKASTTAVVNTSGRVETAQLGIARIRDAEVFQTGVDGMVATTREIRATASAAEVTQPVAAALKNIETELATIKTGANPEAVLRNVQVSIEQIETAGARNIARELKQGLGELENTSTVVDRTRRIEASVATIRTEGASLEAQTSRLSRSFADEAVTAPSASGAALSTNAQVSENLQFISRQAKLLDAGEAGSNAVVKIKDAFTKVEELTAGQLSADQSAALNRIRQTISTIDQASVEATGLRRFETNAARIAEQSGRVESITARVAQTVDMTSPAALDARLEQKLSKINSAAQEINTAKTLDQQITALNKLTSAVSEPELQAVLKGTKQGARIFEDLQVASADLHESVSYRALERYKVVAQAEAENAAAAARALESRIQSDVALSNSRSLQTAASDYRSAAEAFAKAPDKNIAAAQMQQKLEVLQTEIKATTTASTVARGEEMTALTRAHAGLTESVADGELMTRRLIDRRLPVVESGFEQIGRVGSSVVQREIMKDLGNQIQTLRYLEARTGVGAEALDQAQLQLIKAQNDLEVATYRRSLIKLAAAGDQAATDKLLVSGLTSDGYKASAMANASGPAARLFEDFVKNRTNLAGLFNRDGYSVGRLAASDPLFVNNPGWLSAKAIRNTGYTLLGTGGATFGVGAYLRAGEIRAENSRTENGRTFDAKVQPPVESTPVGKVTPVNAAGDSQAAPAASGEASFNRVTGHSAGEPQGFSANGQTIARNAYAQDITSQALPRNAATFNGSVVGDANGATVVPLRPAVVSAGPFIVLNNDVDRDRKLYALSYSGTMFGVKKGADAPTAPEVKVPFATAQTFKIKSGPSKLDTPVDLNRPGSTQFNTPSASLASPFALGLGQKQRDVLTGRSVGGNYGSSSVTSRTGDASMKLASFSEVDAEEGGTGAGTKHLKNVERTESSGIDSNAAHSGGAAVNAQASNAINHDDDDEHGHDPGAAGVVQGHGNDPTGSNDPASSVAATSPSAAASAGPNTSARNGAPNSVGVPPRKRPDKNAISA